jgi:hypothetical protein
MKNGLCSQCGGEELIPCDSGCNPGLELIGGLCRHCGTAGKPPCKNGCKPPLRLANGVCQLCGATGQLPCDSGCDPQLELRDGRCQPRTPPEEVCVTINNPCVPDSQPGKHCCKEPPQLCVYGVCRACILHGEECVPGGTQICCSAKDGDVCMLDQFTEKVVCGIPG